MAFTRNPNMLWNGKPLNNCTHDELVEAVTLLLNRLQNVKKNLKLSDDNDDHFEILGVK